MILLLVALLMVIFIVVFLEPFVDYRGAWERSSDDLQRGLDAFYKERGW